MQSGIFLSARDKSKRLPKKLFLEVKGRPIIEYLIDRLKMVTMTSQIVLCTSVHPDDVSLVKVAQRNSIEWFRGSPEDKLDRYLHAAQKFGTDFIVVVDGDDIFCDPYYIDKVIRAFKETGADYIACKDLPVGGTSRGIKYEALEKICRLKDEVDTEVWDGYFTDMDLFRVVYIGVENQTLKHPEYRMTLDYQEDFEFFKTVIEKLSLQNKVFTLKEVVDLLAREPWIVEINKGVQKLYEEHLKKSAPVKLKKL